MSDVDTLLREYIEAHVAGEDADPRRWLERVEGDDRLRLEALIDRYLEHAPGRAWDAAAFRESGMASLSEQIAESLTGSSGAWPALLPRLRDRARIRRGELVARLAEALGVSDREEKVGSYYHQMEHGLLPADGVSDTVLEALGKILGQSAEALRGAGSMLGPGGGTPGEAQTFAREVRLMHAADSIEEPPPSRAPAPPEEPDEVDRLFREG